MHWMRLTICLVWKWLLCEMLFKHHYTVSNKQLTFSPVNCDRALRPNWCAWYSDMFSITDQWLYSGNRCSFFKLKTKNKAWKRAKEGTVKRHRSPKIILSSFTHMTFFLRVQHHVRAALREYKPKKKVTAAFYLITLAILSLRLIIIARCKILNWETQTRNCVEFWVLYFGVLRIARNKVGTVR